MFAVQADGKEVTTIEGVAENGKMHPIQEGFREEHGLQCGFCTPGMIMRSIELLEKNPYSMSLWLGLLLRLFQDRHLWLRHFL